MPPQLREGYVDEEVAAPVEECGDDEVSDEDGDGHHGVEGEGEDAPALRESHVFRLLIGGVSINKSVRVGVLTCFPGSPQFSTCAVSSVPTAHRVRCLRSTFA